jgi:hypothetical protein
VLVGTWNAELRYGAVTRLVPSWGRPIRGRIVLDRPEPCPALAPRCELLVLGTQTVGFRQTLDPSGADAPRAAAWVQGDGTVHLFLGASGDAGGVMARGRMHDGSTVVGRWKREYLGDQPGGAFVLRRVPGR